MKKGEKKWLEEEFKTWSGVAAASLSGKRQKRPACGLWARLGLLDRRGDTETYVSKMRSVGKLLVLADSAPSTSGRLVINDTFV